MIVINVLLNLGGLVALLERPSMPNLFRQSQTMHSEFELDTVLGTQGTLPSITSFRRITRQKQVPMTIALSTLDDPSESTPVPSIHDKETILNFAKMSSNAYVIRSMHKWRPLPSYEEELDDFGLDGDGLRGYVFANPSKTIVIIAFKGTSTVLNKSPSVVKDKFMDNLMFSCCCGRVDPSWSPVCGCYAGEGGFSGTKVCREECLTKAAQSEDTYYAQARQIYAKVRAVYPKATIWFTGHSLGGALAAVMTAAIPRTNAITFEAPGERLYVERLGLKPTNRVWNYGLSSDPIFTGDCNGVTSPCYVSGYAMESKCRQGYTCTYNIQGRSDISSHRIDWIIDTVLNQTPPPPCIKVMGCHDCQEWTFI